MDKREKLEIRAMAQKYSELAMRTLVNVMRTGETDKDRVSAAKEILDRAHGKSMQGHMIHQMPEDANDEEMLDRAERFTSAIAGLAARAGKSNPPR